MLTGDGFDHAVEFHKIETGVAPKLLKGEILRFFFLVRSETGRAVTLP
ncbi:MAG TPA: hypothetical protein VMJ66_09635 [Geobacteraceae bacterium]|nr:hypothetical protein [Geobacteraceae bacterium]